MLVFCSVGSEEARAAVREGQVRGSASDGAMVSPVIVDTMILGFRCEIHAGAINALIELLW
jgi:hypothetical protein